MVAYLDKYLEPWTVEGAQKADWKILMLDSYRAHWSEDIGRCCWERGYLALYHYGNTTGAMQVNDTHLHGHFKRIFVNYEMENLGDAVDKRPGGH